MPETITAAAMRERLAAGQARALLPEGVPAPVRVDGQWWAIRHDAQDYALVTDPTVAATYTRGIERLDQLQRLSRLQAPSAPLPGAH